MLDDCESLSFGDPSNVVGVDESWRVEVTVDVDVEDWTVWITAQLWFHPLHMCWIFHCEWLFIVFTSFFDTVNDWFAGREFEWS